MERHRNTEAPRHEKTVLPNGLRVLSERLPHLDSVSLGVWVEAGIEEEPPGLEGVTHFVEHMLFKGTKGRSTLQIAQAIDDIGGNVNGYTDKECLYLYAKTVEEHFESALALLFDLLTNCTLPAEDIARERGVVLQEIQRIEDSPEESVHEQFLGAVWPDHPLGRPVMGSSESVRRFERAAVIEHVAQLRGANRIVVSAAGQVEHARLVDLAQRLSAGLRRVPTGPPAAAPDFHSGRRLLPRAGEQVHLCLGVPACSCTAEERHAFALLDLIIGGGTSSRLFQEVRENRGLAYHIGSYLQCHRLTGTLVIDAGTSPDNFEALLEVVNAELDELCANGPSPAELVRARTQMKVALALAAEGSSYRMQHLALSELYWGRHVSLAEIVEGMEAVTAEQVHAVAQSVLAPEKRMLVAIGPLAE